MRKYFHLYKTSLQQELADPLSSLVWAIYGIVILLISIVTWLAISNGSDGFENFSNNEIVEYFLFVSIGWYVIGGSFSQIINRNIIEGQLSNLLLKPFFPYAQAILKEQAWKTLGLIMTLPVAIAFIIWKYGWSLFEINFEKTFLVFGATLIGSLIFGLFEFLIGQLTFWIDNNEGLKRFHMSLCEVLGGFFVPFVLLPAYAQLIAKFLPYRYIMSFPVEIYQNKVSTSELIDGFLLALIWIVILLVVNMLIYKKSLRLFEAYGN